MWNIQMWHFQMCMLSLNNNQTIFAQVKIAREKFKWIWFYPYSPDFYRIRQTRKQKIRCGFYPYTTTRLLSHKSKLIRTKKLYLNYILIPRPDYYRTSQTRETTSDLHCILILPLDYYRRSQTRKSIRFEFYPYTTTRLLSQKSN